MRFIKIGKEFFTPLVCEHCNYEFLGKASKHQHQRYCSEYCKIGAKYNTEIDKLKDHNDRCIMCKSNEDIHQHHIVPKYQDSSSTKILPLCRLHHVMLHRYITHIYHKGYITTNK